MSANAKNANATASEEKKVPTQYSAATDAKIDAVLAEVDEAIGAKVLGDMIDAVKAKPGTAMSLTLVTDEDGKLQVQVDEVSSGGKAKKLVAGAKGVFQRNKKLVIASAGLMATSVLLRVIARRQAELQADEIVENSDDVNADA